MPLSREVPGPRRTRDDASGALDGAAAWVGRAGSPHRHAPEGLHPSVGTHSGVWGRSVDRVSQACKMPGLATDGHNRVTRSTEESEGRRHQ